MTRREIAGTIIWGIVTLALAVGAARLGAGLGFFAFMLTNNCDAMCYEGQMCGRFGGVVIVLGASAWLWARQRRGKVPAGGAEDMPKPGENTDATDIPSGDK